MPSPSTGTGRKRAGVTPFRYDPAVLERFPAVRAALVAVDGAHPGPAPPALSAVHTAAQEEVAARLRSQPIADIPLISGWRRAFRAFGTDPTQHRSAPESLLRRLDKGHGIPPINGLVDVGNVVSIRHALPVAVFDVTALDGAITVRLATGSEVFVGIGALEPTHPDAGEVVFVDGGGTVLARRWCWRQSSTAAVGAATTDALFVVEAHHSVGADDVAAAAAELEGLVRAHLPPTRVTRTTVK
jgi:DNA/RNA-binding domain of Phe-tRNA-synthetase-like protein